MINLILAETAVVCFWIIIAFISREIIKGYFDVFLCCLGLAVSFALIYRLLGKKEVVSEFLKKIENAEAESISKKEELLALDNKKEIHFPGMQKGEVKQ